MMTIALSGTGIAVVAYRTRKHVETCTQLEKRGMYSDIVLEIRRTGRSFPPVGFIELAYPCVHLYVLRRTLFSYFRLEKSRIARLFDELLLKLNLYFDPQTWWHASSDLQRQASSSRVINQIRRRTNLALSLKKELIQSLYKPQK